MHLVKVYGLCPWPWQSKETSARKGCVMYVRIIPFYKNALFLGVSRRGDIEVLIYVLIDWLGGKLPWDTDDPLKPPEIQRMKIEAFHDVRNFLHTTFKSGGPKCPSFIEDLMYSVIRTPFDQAPDYDYLRSLFVPYFRDLGLGHEHAIKHIDEEDQEVIITKPIGRRPSKRRCLSDFVKRQRDNSQPWTENRLDMYNESKKSILRQLSEESMNNPTPAMIEQLGKMKTRNTLPPVHSVRRRKGYDFFFFFEKKNSCYFILIFPTGLWQKDGSRKAIMLEVRKHLMVLTSWTIRVRINYYLLELPKSCNVESISFMAPFRILFPHTFVIERKKMAFIFLSNYLQVLVIGILFIQFMIKCSMKVQNPIYFSHFIWKRVFKENKSNY